MKKLRFLLLAFPLLFVCSVGCDGGGESTIVTPSADVAPSEAEIETEEYEQAMKNMQ